MMTKNSGFKTNFKKQNVQLHKNDAKSLYLIVIYHAGSGTNTSRKTTTGTILLSKEE